MKLTILLTGMLVAAVLAVAGSPSAHAGPSEPDVPGAIAVPAGNKLYLVSRAEGVQIYRCDASSAGFRWAFVGPRADLFAENGKLLATHFGGPTWLARDGSSVVGRLVRPAAVDPTAIPWLLLEAASTSSGADGDRFAGTTYIQRIATVGGLAPAPATCDESTAGTIEEVPYTADYAFWKAAG